MLSQIMRTVSISAPITSHQGRSTGRGKQVFRDARKMAADAITCASYRRLRSSLGSGRIRSIGWVWLSIEPCKGNYTMAIADFNRNSFKNDVLNG